MNVAKKQRRIAKMKLGVERWKREGSRPAPAIYSDIRDLDRISVISHLVRSLPSVNTTDFTKYAFVQHRNLFNSAFG